MTLVSITAPNSGPVATRQGDLVIPGTEVPFGGFSTLIGYKTASQDSDPGDRDVYALGMDDNGLQLARVAINDIRNWSKYTFYDPESQKFSDTPPKPRITDPKNSTFQAHTHLGVYFTAPISVLLL